MESKEFQWTPTLKIELYDFAMKQPKGMSFTEILEQFKASKQRKVLFVTNGDNKPICKGEEFFTVDELSFQMQRWECDVEETGDAPNLKYFSDIEEARKFRNEHAKLYSVKDVREAFRQKIYSTSSTLDEFISELQKKK